MPYFQTKQGGDIAVDLAKTTGAGAVGTANYGITQIGYTSAEVIVIAPPVKGCEKTLVFNGFSTSALPVIKLCTDAAQSVSLMGKSTNLTVIKAAAGLSTVVPTVVTMKGISSTQWLITGVFPSHVTTGTTTVAVGISLSST